jgi:hypothetical protein
VLARTSASAAYPRKAFIAVNSVKAEALKS